MAVFDDTQPWEEKLLVYPHEILWDNNIPIPAKADPERFEIPQSEPLRDECDHFLDCISAGRQTITDGKEGLRVLEVLNASQDSLNCQGERIVLGDARNQKSAPLQEVTGISKQKDFFVHPTSIIDEGCEIEADTKIWHFSHVLSGSKIGEKCNIGQNVVVGPEVVIGKGCKIQNNVSVYKGVTLEDGVFCGPSMVFTNIYNPRAGIRKMDQVRPTLVKRGATLGANSTIVCGTTIGRFAFIGAGAVVNRNVPNHALVAGNPATSIGWVCECGDRLTDDFECLACGKEYVKDDEGLRISSS